MASFGYKVTEDELQIYPDGLDIDMVCTLVARKIEEAETEEGQLIEAFKIFDIDGNGLISPAELRQALSDLGQNLTDEQVDGMIRESDLDGDGHINYKEFVRMMMAKRA